MKCTFCQSELIEDVFGLLCTNETCVSIDGELRDTEEVFRRLKENLCLICGDKNIVETAYELKDKNMVVSYCEEHSPDRNEAFAVKDWELEEFKFK